MMRYKEVYAPPAADKLISKKITKNGNVKGQWPIRVIGKHNERWAGLKLWVKKWAVKREKRTTQFLL